MDLVNPHLEAGVAGPGGESITWVWVKVEDWEQRHYACRRDPNLRDVVDVSCLLKSEVLQQAGRLR
jgi:hypothetical protein